MHLLRSHDSPNVILWWWWSGPRFIQVLIYCGGSVNLLYGIPRRQDNWNQIKLSALPLYMESPLFIYFSLRSSGDHCKQWILWCSIQIDSISHVILSTTNRSDVACSYKQQTKVLCKALALVYIYQHISLHVGRKSDQITRGWDGTITFYLPTRCYPWRKNYGNGNSQLKPLNIVAWESFWGRESSLPVVTNCGQPSPKQHTTQNGDRSACHKQFHSNSITDRFHSPY